MLATPLPSITSTMNSSAWLWCTPYLRSTPISPPLYSCCLPLTRTPWDWSSLLRISIGSPGLMLLSPLVTLLSPPLPSGCVDAHLPHLVSFVTNLATVSTCATLGRGLRTHTRWIGIRGRARMLTRSRKHPLPCSIHQYLLSTLFLWGELAKLDTRQESQKTTWVSIIVNECVG